MANNSIGLAILIGLLALLVGGIVSYTAFPQTIETEVIKEVAGPTVEVEKVVETEVEVIKEVPVDVKALYFDEALDEFFDYIDDDNESLKVCNNVTYDIDQIDVKKIYLYGVSFDSDGDYAVFGDVKLKYLDADTEEKCYQTYDFNVEYDEDDNEPEVTIV